MWCSNYSLLINRDKTKVLLIGVPQLLRQLPAVPVLMLGKEINPVIVAKDLGLYLDQSLTYSDYITKTASNCMHKLIQINRIQDLLDKKTLLLLMDSFIFNKLFYCSTVWSTFSSYSLFESGSGSKLNQAKYKGLWLGAWSGRVDPPVALEWSSDKLKSLGVYLGPANLEEVIWRPRISAVENVLRSWRQRHVFFRGRSLIIGALALARVWYVASLIHMGHV